MKCPKCNQKIEYGLQNCPNCNANVSFSTKVRTEDDNLTLKHALEVNDVMKSGFVIGVLVTVVLLMLFIYGLSFFSFFYINGVLRIIDIIFKTMLISGLIGLIICILLLKLKKRSKLIKYGIIISVALIAIPLLSKRIIQVDEDISLTDYSKVEYIELGEEKIPSLYSVVGERNIVLSDNEKDIVDEGLNITMDAVAIIYTDLSEEDKIKYGEVLIEYGFSLESIYNTDDEEYQNLYMKNDLSDNRFYVVSIDGLSIVYSTSKGTYQDVFNIER